MGVESKTLEIFFDDLNKRRPSMMLMTRGRT